MKGLASFRILRLVRRNRSRLRLAGLILAGFSLLGAAPRPTADAIRALLAQGEHAGECARCHTMHAEGEVMAYPRALIGPDDNTLCDDCHTTPWSGGSYPGTLRYNGSAHGQSSAMIWPGPDPPTRTEASADRKCVNCHDPHGRQDTAGLIPSLALAREEALCLTCHDGNPATTDVQLDLQKAFRHPVQDRTATHTGPTEWLPSDFAASPINKRHAECQDCHNPHVAYRDRIQPPPAPALSTTNLGVSRVRVAHGGPGALPAYTFTAGSDTLSAPLTEAQLCYKCHSSWTTQPTGQTDLARVLNPANPSYHPVEAAGKNLTILPGAFTAGWSAISLTRCGDCHGSDTGTARGPHGSFYRYILKQPYTASAAGRLMSSTETCFSCHEWNVYANRASSPVLLASSRWNAPATDKGHTFHVDDQQFPCYSCHITHGSTTLPHLLVTGRNPGLASYTQTPTGGSCTPTCHAPQTYTINYVR